MIILKLDIAKNTGWALMDSDTSPMTILNCGKKTFWDRLAIDPASKVALMFNFVNDMCRDNSIDQIWIEQLNNMRNAVTTRSLLQQQSGAHLGALQNNITAVEINTMKSLRKINAVNKVSQVYNNGITDIDICDAIMIGGIE